MTLRHFLPFAAAWTVAACSGPAPIPDTFTRTGELIAYSGGGRGAAGACATCHGLKGEGDGHLVPRLAALDQAISRASSISTPAASARTRRCMPSPAI